MHKDTKYLIFFFAGLVIAACVAFLAAHQLPHWLPHEVSGEASSEAAQGHGPGVWQAVLVYLGIAFTLLAVIDFFFTLLTILKLDKERSASTLH